MTQDVEALPGPEPGQLVRIAIPDEGRATASITDVAPAALTLRLVDRSTLRGIDLCGLSAALEWVADEGIHRLLGELCEPPYLHEADCLQFLPRGGRHVQHDAVHPRCGARLCYAGRDYGCLPRDVSA